MVGALVLCFTQVIVRYVFFSSISWSEEIAKWFVIWVTFAGSAYAFKMGTHIGVEALVNLLPPKPRKIIDKIAGTLTVGFFVIMAIYGTLFFLDAVKRGQLAPASRLPMSIAYAALPLGSIMILVRFYITKISRRSDEKESANP